ncbi:ABC transporter substrate-binding protein [Amycolatopsis suaedae]|uniref:ABC transporter substrate-binding protein n=1 Tax=Amycolatopsis suaedae TaxID=2510978 RepID=A0A4Q7IYE6_9PSEU|nr:ABC transporter substrate-binding protein [Amycolatopsis suaedae]RZQ60001.1 ABC transporter substrate-binding protein [Amycolatopsis suaedae]
MSRRLSVLFLLVGLVLAGCADREPAPAPGPQQDGAFPVQLSPAGAPSVTVAKRPERIVALSPTVTEVLYAVGAGSQVVAVDSASDFPPEVPKTPLSGLSPDPEAIAGHNPDLVVVSADRDGKLAAALQRTGVTTLVVPDAKTLNEAYSHIELLGKATGHAAEGADVARRTREDLDKIVAETPKPAKPLRYYHEVDQTFYSVTSGTFIGQVYAKFGLANIADGGGVGDYPQLSSEKVLQANPDLIFLADTKCCGQSPQTVAQRPGWNTLTAVKNGNVVALNDDVASRWTPRIVELARAVGAAVAKAGK